MRYLLEISYKGTDYCGWQIQPNANSVQAEINKALSTVCRQKVETLGCGRTDAGVHARQFFLHFDTENQINDSVLRSLNGLLPKDIAAKTLRSVSDEFHARFDAISRTYEYWCIFEKNPFLEGLAARFHRQPDIEKMNKICMELVKHTDFESFSKVHTEVNNFNCKLETAKWFSRGDLLVFEVTANRFLRNMVRAIVGTLLDVGNGKLSEKDFMEILNSKNRSNAGESVAACGLYLTKVKY